MTLNEPLSVCHGFAIRHTSCSAGLHLQKKWHDVDTNPDITEQVELQTPNCQVILNRTEINWKGLHVQ